MYRRRDELISLFEEISHSVSVSRIFWRLFRNGEMNISQIIRQTGLNHKIVKKSLAVMIDKGFVREKSFGRVRIYFLNKDNPNIRMLLSILSRSSADFFSKDD
ncbi:MAG: ArsR family transcriptional regulator [Thermoproteota archaeon]